RDARVWRENDVGAGDDRHCVANAVVFHQTHRALRRDAGRTRAVAQRADEHDLDVWDVLARGTHHGDEAIVGPVVVRTSGRNVHEETRARRRTMIGLAAPGALAALALRGAQRHAWTDVDTRRLEPERREQRRELVHDVLRGLPRRNGKRVREIVSARRYTNAVAR